MGSVGFIPTDRQGRLWKRGGQGAFTYREKWDERKTVFFFGGEATCSSFMGFSNFFGSKIE